MYSVLRLFIIYSIVILFSHCTPQLHKNITGNTNSDSILTNIYQNLLYKDHTYSPDINTVQLFKSGFENTDPILILNNDTKLTLTFDELAEEPNNFGYELIHCNTNWTKSNINQFDYINGFIDPNIYTYSFSYNTKARYIHYNLTFPDNAYQISKSGNYLLRVYNKNTNETVITKRFLVIEIKVSITANLKQPTIYNYRNTHQEVDFTINHEGFNINNPFEEIKVLIMQNNRWDNTVKNLKPVYLKDHQLIYDYQEENLFPGGKEFRFFDIRSLRYNGLHIEKTEPTLLSTNVFLNQDAPRSFLKYIFQNDYNGKYVIANYNGDDKNIDADYAKVYFSLPMSSPITTGRLFVFGQLTNWDTLSQFEMKYNFENKVYECNALLKQGYYNYEYVFLDTIGFTAEPTIRGFDETLIEGSYYGTENNYKIFVYYRSTSNRYDQLIGYKEFVSTESLR